MNVYLVSINRGPRTKFPHLFTSAEINIEFNYKNYEYCVISAF